MFPKGVILLSAKSDVRKLSYQMNGIYMTTGGPVLLVLMHEVRCPESERGLGLTRSPYDLLQARSLTQVQPGSTPWGC